MVIAHTPSYYREFDMTWRAMMPEFRNQCLASRAVRKIPACVKENSSLGLVMAIAFSALPTPKKAAKNFQREVPAAAFAATRRDARENKPKNPAAPARHACGPRSRREGKMKRNRRSERKIAQGWKVRAADRPLPIAFTTLTPPLPTLPFPPPFPPSPPFFLGFSTPTLILTPPLLKPPYHY